MPKRSKDYVEGLIEDLKDPIMATHYLNAALEDSPQMFLLALRDVAEAYRMSKVAEDAGLTREALYRMLTPEGNPRFSSLTGIVNALGLKITLQPQEETIPVAASAGLAQTLASRIELEQPSKQTGLLGTLAAAYHNFAQGSGSGQQRDRLLANAGH